jgi:plastocyanin
MVAAGLAAFALAGPWGTALAADKFVTMYANEYRPGVVTINVGDTVTWVNDDDVSHDAVGNGWSTSLLGYYESDSVRFRRAGRYAYSCSIHPQMRSAVIVRGATGGATVPPTDTTVTLSDQADPPNSWVTVSLVLIAGSAVLVALVWPRRSRPEG